MHNGAIMSSEVRHSVDGVRSFPLVRLSGVLDRSTAGTVRGVLLDVARHKGVDHLDDGYGISNDELDAVAKAQKVEIKKGDSPYKASISLASSIFGYAMGQQAADWLEGKSVPQAMDILPMALTRSNIADYERDTANPGAVYADASRRASYFKMNVNISFDTRGNYINFPWSSETK